MPRCPADAVRDHLRRGEHRRDLGSLRSLDCAEMVTEACEFSYRAGDVRPVVDREQHNGPLRAEDPCGSFDHVGFGALDIDLDRVGEDPGLFCIVIEGGQWDGNTPVGVEV